MPRPKVLESDNEKKWEGAYIIFRIKIDKISTSPEQRGLAKSNSMPVKGEFNNGNSPKPKEYLENQIEAMKYDYKNRIKRA